MVGLFGIIRRDSPFKDCINTTMNAIEYNKSDTVDQWCHDSLSVIRIHHGIIDQEPQPIFNEENNLCIVMDGEVFDYETYKNELRQQGHRFKTQSSAEFCLHFYEEKGKESFKELNGSFFLLIYNLLSKELLLVCDRFSSRPIFYCYDKEKLVFGSHPQALFTISKIQKRLDKEAVFEFFTFQRILGERTFNPDIKVLPPANFIQLKNSILSINQYWKMKYKNEPNKEDYFVEKLADSIVKSVSRRTQGNYRYGILLSGGLDSRAVMAGDKGKKISVAYTLGDFFNNEAQTAKKISNIMGCKHIFLKRQPDHYFKIVEEAVKIGAGMYRFDHAHFLSFIEEIRNECNIVLHGHGLDYTFQGLYLPHSHIQIFGKKLSLPVLAKLDKKNLHNLLLTRLSYSTFSFGVEKLFSSSIRSQYLEKINEEICKLLNNREVYGKNLYNGWDYFVLHSLSKHFTFLNFLCVREYLDERTLIYDNDLYDLYLSMPPILRNNGRILRKAIKLLSDEVASIPNANTNLPIDMPVWFEWMEKNINLVSKKIRIRKEKHFENPIYTNGSWPNMAELIRTNIQLKNLIWDTIHDPESLNPDIFDIKNSEKVFIDHIERKSNNTSLLFLLLTFGVWYKNL